MFFTISGGAASFNTQENSYEDVLKNAKFALHVSKLNGKNTFTPYSEDEYLSYIRRIDNFSAVVGRYLKKQLEETCN